MPVDVELGVIGKYEQNFRKNGRKSLSTPRLTMAVDCTIHGWVAPVGLSDDARSNDAGPFLRLADILHVLALLEFLQVPLLGVGRHSAR